VCVCLRVCEFVSLRFCVFACVRLSCWWYSLFVYTDSDIAKDLQMRIINLLLGDHFFIYQIFVEPSDVMHDGISRKRTYVYLLNKKRGVYLYDVFEMYEEIKHKLKRICKTKPSDYLVATPTQKALDAMALATARKIPYDPEHWLHTSIKPIGIEQLFC
jgi:hypothetical protein